MEKISFLCDKEITEILKKIIEKKTFQIFITYRKD